MFKLFLTNSISGSIDLNGNLISKGFRFNYTEIYNNVPVTNVGLSDPTYITYFQANTGAIACTLNLPEATNNDTFGREYVIKNLGSTDVSIQHTIDGDTFLIATLLPYQQIIVHNRDGEYSFGSIYNLDERFSVAGVANKVAVRDNSGNLFTNNLHSNNVLTKIAVQINDGSTQYLSANSQSTIIIIGVSEPFTQPVGFVLPHATTLLNPLTNFAHSFSFRNETDREVDIFDATESLIATIKPRRLLNVILIDNSTIAGAWDNTGGILTEFTTSVPSEANRIPIRDTDRSIRANRIIQDVTTYTEAGALFINLNNTSTVIHRFSNALGTDSGNGISLPTATTLELGRKFLIINNADKGLEVYATDMITVLYTLEVGQSISLELVNNITANGVWKVPTYSDSTIDGGIV